MRIGVVLPTVGLDHGPELLLPPAEAGVTLVVVQVTLLPQAIPDAWSGSPPR